MAASDESDAALSDKVSNIQELSNVQELSIFCSTYALRPAACDAIQRTYSISTGTRISIELGRKHIWLLQAW